MNLISVLIGHVSEVIPFANKLVLFFQKVGRTVVFVFFGCRLTLHFTILSCILYFATQMSRDRKLVSSKLLLHFVSLDVNYVVDLNNFVL